MGDDSTSPRSSRLERFRRRRRDAKQRREWRRERRKGVTNPYDSTNKAESELYRGGFFTKR
jgi:hypothetical protein